LRTRMGVIASDIDQRIEKFEVYFNGKMKGMQTQLDKEFG